MSAGPRILAAAMAIVVGGCEPAPPALSPLFGGAVIHNMAVHVIPPDPAAPVAPPAMDGNRAALRMEQYRKGQVVPIREPGTQAVTTPGRTQ